MPTCMGSVLVRGWGRGQGGAVSFSFAREPQLPAGGRTGTVSYTFAVILKGRVTRAGQNYIYIYLFTFFLSLSLFLCKFYSVVSSLGFTVTCAGLPKQLPLVIPFYMNLSHSFFLLLLRVKRRSNTAYSLDAIIEVTFKHHHFR